MKRCPLYEQGKAFDEISPDKKNKLVLCRIEGCPYFNSIGKFHKSGEGLYSICNSNGFLNIEEDLSFNAIPSVIN